MATNILLDCVCSIAFSAADLGGGETYSGTRTFKADKVSVKQTMANADHSTGQDRVAHARFGKEDWEISIDTKLYDSTLLASLMNNDLASITVTAQSGRGAFGFGLIVDRSWDYDKPSTMKFGIKAHGTGLTSF